MESFANAAGLQIALDLIVAINENKQKLSDIDGLIGDGDHGINMNKGFTQAGAQIKNENVTNVTESFRILSSSLMEIGGAMGPLYGSIFRAMARKTKDQDEIDTKLFASMLSAALEKVKDLGGANPGDKTLLDCLSPAVESYNKAVEEGKGFSEALDVMKEAAAKGRDATVDMVAKKGRASRLGERSKGVPDAGATSCCLILTTMADSIQKLLSS